MIRFTRTLQNKVTFYLSTSANAKQVSAQEGKNLLGLVLKQSSGNQSLIGLCGGCLQCTTCRVKIVGWQKAGLPQPQPEQLDVLDLLKHTGQHDRMACQITVNSALQGLVVELPEDVILPQ